MSDAKLKSIVDRIERLEEEQRGLGQDKRDIFTEAKSSGYNPKVLRRLIRERKRDTAEQAAEDAELETYRAALGMAVELVRSGLSQRKAAKQAGVSKSSLNRALAVPAVSHDPETGEITELEQPGWSTDPQIKPALPEVAGDPLDRDCGGSIGARAASEEVPQETSGLLGVSGSPERAAQNSESCGGAGPIKEPDTDSPAIGHPTGPQDPWTPPPFLDRRKVAA